MLLFAQHLGQALGIGDGGLQRRHLLVGVDADYEGMMFGEREVVTGLVPCELVHQLSRTLPW